MDQSEFTEADKAFFSDGLKLAEEALLEGKSPQRLIDATNQQYQAIDGLVESLQGEAKRHNITIECKAGCDWCCHQPIFATSHEFYTLFKYMKDHFSEFELRATIQKAYDNYQKRGRMEGIELEKSKMPCPLLLDGKCNAYEARPMACRIYLSMDVKSCQTFFNDPYHKTNYPALLEFPLQAGRMMNEGMNNGLREDGTITYELLMEEGLLMANNNDEPLNQESYSNHPLFK